MFKKLFEKLARFLLPEVFNTLENRALYTEQKINARVAGIVANLDPMELVLKNYKSSFLKEYRRAEEDLDEPSKIQMEMWAYRNHNDPCFIMMMEWVANKQGVFSFTHAKKMEDVLFGQAAVVTIEVLKSEVTRLNNLYEKRLKGDDEFNTTNTVED